MASTVTSLRPRLRTVSIMPGIEARAPERTDTSSGFSGSPKVLPAMTPTCGERRLDLAVEVAGIGLAVCVVIGADLGRDGEAGGHRQAQIAHLGEVRALAAEQIAHSGLTLGLAVAERVHPLRHRAVLFCAVAKPRRIPLPSMPENAMGKEARAGPESSLCLCKTRNFGRIFSKVAETSTSYALTQASGRMTGAGQKNPTAQRRKGFSGSLLCFRMAGRTRLGRVRYGGAAPVRCRSSLHLRTAGRCRGKCRGWSAPNKATGPG